MMSEAKTDLTALLGDLRRIYEELYCNHNEDLAISALAARTHLERFNMLIDDLVTERDLLAHQLNQAKSKIDLLTEIVSELSQALHPHYIMSERGRAYMAKMAKALNA